MSQFEDKIQFKRAKADRYVSQPERFTLVSIDVKMKSDHDTCLISLRTGEWFCTCDFFQERKNCSHIMAVKKLYNLDHTGGG